MKKSERGCGMIPEKFKERMQAMLGDEYTAFISALENEASVRGGRVNLIKTSGKAPLIDGVAFTPLSYVDNGYIVSGECQIGRTAEHHAGMIYMQDPGAMAAVAALDIDPAWWVADLCAAPGGKSSQIAERLGDGGFLLSNEYVPKRAKITVGNLERLGVKNAIVTSMDTSRLTELYCEAFDLVVADAPCSGEGMFRKSEEAIAEWSEDNVIACAKRQGEILSNAYSLVRPGGYLLYSTCTWSKEENEDVVERFMREHPDMELAPVKEALREVSADGIAPEGSPLKMCRRFYPHIAKGEGQFVALFKKRDGEQARQTILYKENVKAPNREEMRVIEKFFSEVMLEAPQGRLIKSGDNVILIPHGCPLPPHSVFMSGVLVGEISREILRPSHHFFSAYGQLFKLKLKLSRGDARVGDYLRGLEIDADTERTGWCAVIYEGAVLGGGKVSAGRLKNHYPKGLRNS